MKKLIVFILVATFTLPLMAQKSQNLFEKLTEEYADRDGFSASQISRDMFDLYLKKRKVEDDSPVAKALEELDNITVISQSSFGRSAELIRGGYIKAEDAKSDESDIASEVHKKILDYYKTSNYTLLKTEKRLGEDIKVYLKKSNDKIESLALIANSSVSTSLVELQGNINLKIVSELGGALNLRGLENLYKINNSNSQYGYSSGISSAYAKTLNQYSIMRELEKQKQELANSGELTKERKEQLAAIEKQLAKQQRFSEAQIEEIEAQAKQMSEKQLQVAKKYREMAEKYRRQPIFLSAPGDTNTVYYLNGKKVKAKNIKELNSEDIESVEVNNADKEGEKSTIKIKTK